MSQIAAEEHDWRVVDEGWGGRAVDFATLSEPANCREYVAMHQRLGVGRRRPGAGHGLRRGAGAGAGRRRGATCAGIDASPPTGRGRPRPQPGRRRARRRHARPALGRRDLRRRHQLPRHLGDHARRASPRSTACCPRRARRGSPCGATSRRRPGRGPSRPSAGQRAEGGQPGGDGRAGAARRGGGAARPARLRRHRARRRSRSSGSSPTPHAYARALASTGPAYEAIQAVGEEAFIAAVLRPPPPTSATGSPSGPRSTWSATSPASPTERGASPIRTLT